MCNRLSQKTVPPQRKRRRCAWRVCLAGLIVTAFSAFASGAARQDLTELSLDELMDVEIVGASKFEQKPTEAPSSITVLTADEFKKSGYRTLADALQSVQGFHVSYDRNYAFLGTRGINLGDFNSRILLLIDGHRINNNLTDGAFIDSAFLLDVDLIERVEIIRGPGSVLYGNNAFFAVINVITRRGKNLDGVELSGEYGKFDTYKGRFTIGQSYTNGLEFLLSGSWYDSNGDASLFYEEFDTPAQNNGVADGLDDDRFHSFFGSVGYRDFTVQGGYIRREKINPTAQYFTTFNDSRLTTTDERSYAALKYAHSFEDFADVTAQVYYDRYEYSIGYPFISGGTDFTSYENDTGEWWGTELQLTKRLWDRHIVTVGAEYRNDFTQEYKVSGQPTITRDQESFGVYAQGDFAVLTNLHLNGGVRYDQYGDFDPEFNPRLAAIYHPVESATIKALYGTAFRDPNFLESIDPRYDLQPEEITSYELVYEQNIGRHFRTSVSGFYNDMDDLIVFNNGGFTNFDAETKGIEVALNGFWTNGLRARLSYSYQETRNHDIGWDMPDSPHHQFKLNVTVPLYRDKIFGSVEFQYLSGRDTLHNQPDPVLGQLNTQGERTGGYGVVNLTLFSQNLLENLEFSVGVYNLFDTHYSDPATRYHVQDELERDGRSFRFKLTYRF